MDTQPNQRALIVAGDYDVVLQVGLALEEGGFTVECAYSYRDALHALESSHFDVALVDGAMTDRASGEPAIKLLETFQVVPMILLAREGHMPGYSQPPVQMVLGSLDKRTILRAVLAVLHIPLPHGKPLKNEEHRRIEEIETLFALGKSLTEVLDLSEVLSRVVAAARHLTGAEEGMILLPDDNETGQLYLRAKVGIDETEAQNFRIRTEDTVAGHVFHSGQSQLIGSQGLTKVKTHYFVKALLYVPILLQGKPIGVLGVNNKIADEVFNAHEEELLRHLASYAAIAIENARIHEETLERTRELESLVNASQVVNSSLALDKTLPNVCEQLAQVLNVHWTEIYAWDRERRQLRTRARYQGAVWRAGQGPVIKLEHYPARRSALEQNRFLSVTRAEAVLAGEAAHLSRAGVHTLVVIPVYTGDQVLGAVQSYFVNPPKQPFTAEMVQAIQRLSLEGLAALGDKNSANHRHIFPILTEINRLLKADWSELAELAHRGQALSVLASVGAAVWLKPPYPVIDLDRQPDLQTVVAERAVLNERVGTGGGPANPLLHLTHSHGILALPLIQRGQAQGLVLFGDTRNNRTFSPREIDLGKTIVAQAATALENASLVHDLAASLQELRDTQERLVQTARLSAMGELAAAVAHQINNPLTTILVDTELMLLDETPTSRNYKSLTAISRAGKRAAGVVRRLLATARPTEENAPIEPIDVTDNIEGILSLVKHHIESDHIQVIPNLPQEKLPPVWAVQGQLDDIWLNLLLNAHDALIGRAGAQVGIEAAYKPGDDWLEVTVWDNGPGIPQDIVDEIFKPFFTTKPVGEGTGLGLHICRQVIEQVGGIISVNSVPEKGTHFLVRLPVKKGNDS